jgi:hypothetical protein
MEELINLVNGYFILQEYTITTVLSIYFFCLYN